MGQNTGPLRVLFVDDEAHVLQGLRRSLRAQGVPWEMQFAASGKEAMFILATGAVDVVVSDMRMPEMNGAELLRHVRQQYPDVVRIILSGHSDRHLLLEALGNMHQYLSKPCDAEVLRRTLTQTVRTQRLLANTEIRNIVFALDAIPSLPATLQMLLAELQSPLPSTSRVGELIAQDPSLTAQVLRLINSPFFGLRREVTSPVTAASLLGLDTLGALLVSQQLFAVVPERQLERIGLGDLYAHSARTSRLAGIVMRAFGQAGELESAAKAAGLLHDIGKLLVALNFPARYEEAVARAERGECDLRIAEMQVAGAPHDWIGGYVLGLWGVPSALVDAVAHHHDPRADSVVALGALTAVHVANVLDHVDPSVDCWPPAGLDLDYLVEVGVPLTQARWAQLVRERSVSEAV